MRLHRVLLATLFCTGCGAAPQATLTPPPASSFAIQGTLSLQDALEARIVLMGQSDPFSFTSSTEDWSSVVFSCNVGAPCNLVIDVPTSATYEGEGSAYVQGQRGATVGGVPSDIVLGDLSIHATVTAGEATEAVPVTISGTLTGYDLTMPCPPNPPGCEPSAPVWKVTITGSGTMSAFQVVPGVWESATAVFTGTATSEPLD